MALAHANEASKVLILANSHLKESLELANYYANARNIPKKNIVSLPMPLKEEINWADFSIQILNPLRQNLLDRGFLEGILEKEIDAFGRQKYSPLFNSAKYLVLCRGTPLKLTNEIDKVPEERLSINNKIYQTTAASIDAELALIPSQNQSTVAYTNNPVFNLKRTNSLTQENILLVSRLDGPTHKACIQIINSSLAGENGAYGRAYLDLGGPHKQGNDWLENIATQLNEACFSLSQETTRNLFNSGHRFDAPVLYFGWHKWHAEGPFSRIDFNVPPGALHFHLHSFSAQTLRSDRQNWVGPIIAGGAAGTIGNVNEPYLHLTHHLHKLCEALLEGKSLGEAGYYSLPVLSWQAVLIGDPLYRPKFNPEIPRHGQTRGNSAPFHLQQYGAMSQYRKLLHSGETKNANAFASNYLTKSYGLPFALEIAINQDENTVSKSNIQQLFIPIRSYTPIHFQECPVLLDAVKLLQKYELFTLANEILQNLKNSNVLPSEIGWRDLR